MHTQETNKRHFGRKTAVILAVALVLAVLSVSAFYNANGKSLDVRDREVRLIVTDSMDGERMPYSVSTIPKDSLVVVKLISDEEKKDLQTGDVIQFRYGSVLNHHRVVSNKDHCLLYPQTDCRDGQ